MSAALLPFVLGAAAASAASVIISAFGRRKKRSLGRPVYVSSIPHPAWTPGQPQPCPLPGFDVKIAVDPATYDKASLYALTISAVVPRPIAFITSENGAGGINLSPYSYFNVLGHNPPMVAVGCCRSPLRGGGKKDTFTNIEETGEFVINIISDWFVEAANHTCGDFPPGMNEMEVAGLTPEPSIMVKPPRVKESAVQFECKLRHIYPVTDKEGKPTAEIVIGEVVMIHVSEAVADKSPSGKLTVDPVKLAPIARMGGVTYAACSELFSMPRPDGQGKYPTPAPPAAPKK